ncbi:hypothetical protein LTR37_002708 [Vermiconidia calcicola]|uniref:Uncharacterized protein n=1 Tax=Vermiconidia calcicola TaxID=1690605 RepID=A0ACC3NTB8_9PEZI|nr:hypothetical protein LTR37_002708 [Vermiconidia calcicola]
MPSSYLAQQFHTTPFKLQHQPSAHEYEQYTPESSFGIDSDCTLYTNNAVFSELQAVFEEQKRHCMNNQLYAAHPDIRVEASTPTPLPPSCDGRQDSVASGLAHSFDDWQMYQWSMGMPATSSQRPLKRARSHQRTPSASTVASTGGPASPYTANNTSYPQIANTDYSSNSPAQRQYADQTFSKHLPTPQQTPTDGSFFNTPSYIPSQFAHTPNAHLAMKGFAIDHHLADDFPPEYIYSSAHSMSSHGNDSPATPQSGVGDAYDSRNFNTYDYTQANPNVQLYRTESQAYQDELFNPGPNYNLASAPATKRKSALLTPHRNLINERLQTANLARSGSPASAVSRERSPFRAGSPLAPAADWNTAQTVGTAAGMRQQQKEEAAQAEYAQHQPPLRREPTKTISPKDALLDYGDTEQPSLFQENIPAGYRQHTTDPEAWQNGLAHPPGSTFGNIVATGPAAQLTPLRAASADGYNEANLGFTPLPPTQQDQSSQIQSTPYQSNTYASKMNYDDTNPGDFPAHLTSMESSISENGPPPSSQESYNMGAAPQRPADTRANAGAYTCTYHGCAQRFESHTSLQKHKKEYHRSHPRESTSDSPTGSNASPRSTESPAPSSTDGMTSAAIQARNSQAGPHKCTRINPSTNKPCNTIFSRPYDLTRHEDTIHKNRKHKVRCPTCREEKTFSRNDALTRHMRVVHPEVETFGKRGRRGE